jgi:hypothetical protein
LKDWFVLEFRPVYPSASYMPGFIFIFCLMGLALHSLSRGEHHVAAFYGVCLGFGLVIVTKNWKKTEPGK